MENNSDKEDKNQKETVKYFICSTKSKNLIHYILTNLSGFE